VQNVGPSQWNELKLNLKNSSSISLGNVGPNSSVETEKVGPFAYSHVDSVFDLKGALAISDATVPIKISMPMTAHLNSLEGLTLEDLSSELSSPSISSHSAKIDLPLGTALETIKPTLCSFLNAVEVENGLGGSSTTGTLAAQSAGGAKLFFLLKIKEKNVKVDLKCTHPNVGKEVASDLKRLVL
jgi:hypothetical protein